MQVNPASLATSAGVTPTGTFVLVAERDYSTGKIYLTAQEISKATLTHSLWKIKETARSANGRVFTYVNKETGYELAFDHTNALVLNHGAGEDVLFSGANKGWTYENDGLTDGCNDHWVWYTTDDNGTAELNYKKVYSYFHNGTDYVMALRAARRSANIEDVAKAVYDAARADGSKVVDVLSENGLDGTATGGYAIVAVKDSKGNAQDWLDNVSKALEIKPVVAGAKVLNFAEINSMIDADGSYLTFGQNGSQYIKNYGDWLDAKEVDKAGKFAKFTVLKPGTNEPLNVVDGANPFAHAFTDGKFVAEAYYENLARNNYDATSKTITNATGNQYAGYDILLRTKDAIQQVGGEKQYGYLYVSEYTYEPKTATSNHDGLQVKIQPYSYLSNGAAGGDRKIVKEIDRGAAYITDGYPDALEARYHWKVTYYATNDSLVLEPLNASRMNTKEMAAETPFEKTHLARSVWTVYTTGYAVAAAELRKEELLVTLIAQQIRNAVFNKTFYEVYNADDGRAWRWPAQTWNAIGYISLLLSGVFGLKKDIEGIWFEGFIPTVLSGIRIFNLRYVNMCLDVSSEGEGKIVKMTLNGVEVKKIFWNLQGHHKVKLICRKED